MTSTAEPASKAGIYARLVGAGIFLSRISGFIRQRVIAHFFGNTLFADAFLAALRIPNIVQNLLGEGTLSASFIPVYTELLHEGREEEAGRVAGAVFALLLALAGTMSLLGIFLAPYMVDLVAPGFRGERLALTVQAVRIMFPMTGVLVLSAWALGILNSHRSFFLSYVAPVVSNAAIIAALLFFGTRMELSGLVIAASWGALVGGVLQFLVQLPRVLRLEPRLRVRMGGLWTRNVREVVHNAGPAVLGRGVVQLSAYVDVLLASLLSQGALAAMGYASMLYLLPISLFGMSVAASELPELARQRVSDQAGLAQRVSDGLRQIAVYVVPSTVGYILLGDVVVGAIYQTGRFGRDDTIYVTIVLIGFALGLMASTGTRLFSSTFFALHDTKTPAKIAALRVVVTAAIGYALMFPLERNWHVMGHPMGVFGLTLGAGVAAWLEWWLLKRVLRGRIGRVGAGARPLGRMFAAALLAAALGRAIAWALPPMRPIFAAVLVLGPYGTAYFLLAHAFGVEEAREVVGKVVRRIRR